ncbi:hypothetical protein BVRB_3g058030 [Beta vulgaris subsp. vulgaris]|nr:hypothetical protein BVRB_3g058030 [Beta vulgaris subsp. vulgaris]
MIFTHLMDHSSNTLLTIVVLFWILTPFVLGDEVVPRQVLKPYCSHTCGNVSIPYPFGIEDGCYFVDDKDNYKYKFVCNDTYTPPRLIFGTNLEVLKISLEGELTINSYVSFDCYNQSRQLPYERFWSWVNLVRFTVSNTKNFFIAIGCDTYVWFSGYRHGRPYETGCMTQCSSLEDVVDGACNGIGCCETTLPEGVSNMTIRVRSFSNHSLVPFNPCSSAFPVERETFKFYQRNLTQDSNYYLSNDIKLPIIFNWTVGTVSCSVAKADSRSYMCTENTECYDTEHEIGYRCKCKHGYSGNPYLSQGCTDVDECHSQNECEKPDYCINIIGGYICQCPKGHHGNGTKTDRCVSNRKAWLTPVFVTGGVGGGIIALLVIVFLLHWHHGKRELKKMREKLFRENGGFLLHQKLSGQDNDILKIFTIEDLEKATDNYNNVNIIGRGGFGIVYKGTMPNNQVVAIKKSIKVDPKQAEQFVNEVLILSKINNRNVVKLLGCCLEDEVPLLVYEFISNGTLYEHLHEAVRTSILTWPMRLKIALDVADVLSYLHNTISPQIIHRDMKSLNIMLDEKYTAKVTDFGASRLVPLDQGQLATMVLGTWGYLDPEYMQTNDLTEKSDVYSFGVVLVELLTKKKAISNFRPEIEKCLAMHFLLKMKEGRLLDILDKNIVNDATIEQIQQVANLAKGCLMLKGEDRPTMKEVSIELETIKSKGSHPWNNNDAQVEEDCQLLLGGTSGSGAGGCSSGIDSDLYNPHAPLGSGR